MFLNHISHFFTTQSTLLTALASWALVFITWYLIRKQIKSGKKDLLIRLERDLVKRFESELLEERKKLANQLLNNVSHEEIQEPVLNFFEDVGFYLKRKYLDKEFVWHDFAYYSIHWWYVLKEYIDEERKRHEDDNTIFASFEYLAREMKKFDDKKVREMNKRKNKNKKHLIPPDGLKKEDIIQFLSEESV